MTENTKITYNFHNAEGETVQMTFTMIEIEGAEGGFINQVQAMLNEEDFGQITDVYRVLSIK